MKKYLDYLEKRLPEMISAIMGLVEIETPSGNAAQCSRAAEFIKELIKSNTSAAVDLKETEGGAIVLAEWGEGEGGDILLAGHFDTVHKIGSLKENPCRKEGDRLYGPGVYDMKAGIVQAIFAISAVERVSKTPNRRIKCIFNCDEEIGSKLSRQLIEDAAKTSDCAFVFEFSAGLEGALKLARKGVGVYRIAAYGKASHAGNCPEKGANAIEEICRQVLFLQGLNDNEWGITVNCGLISGGSARNTVSDYAEIQLDVRAASLEDAEWIDGKIKSIVSVNPEIRLEVSGGFSRPPMEETEKSRRLFLIAQEIMEQQGGGSLAGRRVGGASDANLISAFTPVLDGLGAVGDGAHTKNEWIDINRLAERTALAAALIERLDGEML